MNPVWSNKVKFYPWIGNNYTKNKILILGDSHYDWEYKGKIVHVNNKKATQGYIEGLIDPEIRIDYGNKGTWTKLEKAFIGDNEAVNNGNAIYKFWHSVAFYNFVQKSVPEGSRVSPTAENFNKSIPAFNEVISILKPQTMIVLGVSRLWWKLPHAEDNEPFFVDGRRIETCIYKYKYGQCFSFPIYHPSSAFNPNFWYKVIWKGIGKAQC